MDGKSHENGTESLNLSPNSNKSVHKSKTFTKEESDTEKKESTLKEDNSLAVDNSTEKSRTWVKEKDKSNLKQSEKPISQPISPQPATISNEALKVENKNPEVGVHSRPNSRSDNKQTDFRRSLVLSSTGLRARPIKTPTTAGDLESTSRNKSDITISPESGETNNNLVSEKNISPESVDNSKRANCDQIKETVVETNKEPVHDSNEKTGNNLRGEKESDKESHDKSKPLKATQKEKVNETNSASDLNVKEGPDNKKVFGPEESSYLKNKEKKTIADQSNTQTQDNSGVTVDKTKKKKVPTATLR